MLKRNSSLGVVSPGGLKTGDEHCGQFICFADERLKFLGIEISAIDSQPEPEVALVGFFERDLKFREKLSFRTTSPRSSIVRSHASGTAGQLIRYRAGSRTHRHSVGDLKAIKCETPGSRKQFAHRLCIPAASSEFNVEFATEVGLVLRSKF